MIVIIRSDRHYEFTTDTMLDNARRGNFTVARPMEFFGASFDDKDRVSLIQLLREFLLENNRK